jgi:hypothetical protein
MNPIIGRRKIRDIRPNADETAAVKDGMLYRKGGTVQVWWSRDAAGRPFCGDEGRETWTLDNSEWGIEQAKRNFAEMKERWS